MAEEGRGEDVKYSLVPRLSSSFLSLSVQFKGLQVTKLAGQGPGNKARAFDLYPYCKETVHVPHNH